MGRGENRAMEAAQQAISSPLLDNVSVSGATGVPGQHHGWHDLTLGEVHQINEIVHAAVGDDAEIIFGAVHEPAMQGEIRVTVIATGLRPTAAARRRRRHGVGAGRRQGPERAPLPAWGPAAAGAAGSRGQRRHPALDPGRRGAPSRAGAPGATGAVTPGATPPSFDRSGSQDLSDMEIPTFIRRQMD
jgi:cell division protein FtsZ